MLTDRAVHITDDDPDAVSTLIGAAGGPMFDHRVARLRRDRVSNRARAQVETPTPKRDSPSCGTGPPGAAPRRWHWTTCAPPDGFPATDAAVTDPRTGR